MFKEGRRQASKKTKEQEDKDQEDKEICAYTFIDVINNERNSKESHFLL